MAEKKLPWPSDAIMIVAADAGMENIANMESAVPAKCRVCVGGKRGDRDE